METDEVLLEIPVYLNRLQNPPHFFGELSLLQFPLRPSSRPYEDLGTLESVSFTDENPARLLLKYANNQMDKESSASCKLLSRTVPVSNSGLLALVIDDMVGSAVPVAAISQFRPYFQENSKPVASPPPGLTAKQQHFVDLSSALLKSNGVSCNWNRGDFYEADSVESYDLIANNIIVDPTAPAGSQLIFDDTKEGYLENLVGSKPQSEAKDSASLSRLDYAKQIESIMKQRQCASLVKDIIPALAPNTRAKITENQIISVLDQIAYIIQGNWVLRSPLTSHRQSLWNLRDLLLVSLKLGRELKTAAFVAFSGGMAESEIEEVFKPLCMYDPGKGSWRFKLIEDVSFISKNPELCEKHSSLLDSVLRNMRNERSGGAQSTTVNTTDEPVIRAVSDHFNRGVVSLDDVRKVIQSKTPDKLVSPEHALDILNRVGAWQLRPQCFVLFRDSDRFDRMRRALASFYSHRDSATKAELMGAIQKEELAESFSDHDIRKVIKEFASLQRGMWVFHQGISVKEE